MTGDPYDGYVEALLGLIESTAGGVSSVSDLGNIEYFAEEAVENFESGLAELARRSWENRAAIERRYGKRHARAFRAVDSMLALTHAVGRFLENELVAAESNPPHSVRYSTSLLLTRAVSVGHEIHAMLRAGFPIGAHARWRTLYEIGVVTAVLHKGNRWTAARYVNHRWILIAKRSPDYLPEEDEWRIVRSEAERTAKALIRRYGKSYGTTYGWAAELTKRKLGVERPQFWHLERIARLDSSRRHLPSAHHGVHADALGGIQTLDADLIFHSGARSEGIEEVCALLVRTLGEIEYSIVRMWSGYLRSNDLIVLAALLDELSLTLEREVASSLAWRRTDEKDTGGDGGESE